MPMKYLALTTLFVTGLAVAPAGAQNPNFALGDLLMGFQLRSGVGSDQTILVNLGDTATVFRDASSINLINIANIGGQLYVTYAKQDDNKEDDVGGPGNGYVDIVKGEQCDAGGANANAPNAPCRLGCTLPKCGDGIVDNTSLVAPPSEAAAAAGTGTANN